MSSKKPAYEPVEQLGRLAIVRHAGNHQLYVTWYASEDRQTRRVSLRTTKISDACAAVQACIDAGGETDPKAFFQRRRIVTVRDLLTWREPQLSTSPSHETEKINIRILLKSSLADRRLTSLTSNDFDNVFKEWLASGSAISTVSRRLSVLRAAANRAVRAKEIAAHTAPKVPEYCKKHHLISAPTKGEVAGPAELALLYDALEEPHLKVFFALLFGTAARRGALLELTREQCHLKAGLLELNAIGRLQTAKTRPTIRLIKPLNAWIEPAPPGLLVHWNGQPIKSLKSGLRAARSKAGLSDRINTYSARHGAGRFMRSKKVSLEEIGFWLGHGRPEAASGSTSIYAPYSPDYLDDATAAMTAFFIEIANHTRTPLIEPPPDVLAYYEVQHDRKRRKK